MAYASDEFYLIAERELPDADYYGEFSQLDNGVGVCALLKDEFLNALDNEEAQLINKNITIATGCAAYDLLCELSEMAMSKLSAVIAILQRITVTRGLRRFYMDGRCSVRISKRIRLWL